MIFTVVIPKGEGEQEIVKVSADYIDCSDGELTFYNKGKAVIPPQIEKREVVGLIKDSISFYLSGDDSQSKWETAIKAIPKDQNENKEPNLKNLEEKGREITDTLLSIREYVLAHQNDIESETNDFSDLKLALHYFKNNRKNKNDGIRGSAPLGAGGGGGGLLNMIPPYCEGRKHQISGMVGIGVTTESCMYCHRKMVLKGNYWVLK